MNARVAPDISGLMLRMMDVCARAEHSSAEICSKLLRSGLSPSDAARIVDRLKADGFIDDCRFARAYVSDKIRFSHWGRNKIRRGLLSKGICGSELEEALSNVDMKEYGMALLKTATAKSKGLDLDDYHARMRLYRSLASRGYELEYINKVIDYLRR